MPWRGPTGEGRHTGVSIPVWEREGEALGVPSNKRLRRQALPGPRQRLTKTAPSHGATQSGDVSASRVRDKAVAS
jgi:hypothetical protein